MASFFFFFFCFLFWFGFLGDWGLNLELRACKADALSLESTPPVHFALVILEMEVS
jgi:hypothetical protein